VPTVIARLKSAMVLMLFMLFPLFVDLTLLLHSWGQLSTIKNS
jgi:hypothetical protein